MIDAQNRIESDPYAEAVTVATVVGVTTFFGMCGILPTSLSAVLAEGLSA